MSKQAQDFTAWYTDPTSLTELLMRDHGCIHHNGPNPEHQGCRACQRRTGLILEWFAAEVAAAEQRGRETALREAADALVEYANDVYWRKDSQFHAAQHWALSDTAAVWLRKRANEERE